MNSLKKPGLPRPVRIWPKNFKPDEWIVQPKYRGWRIYVLNNKVFTRHHNPLNITTNFRTDIEYLLDGEIISKDFPSTEYKVPKAIRENNYELKIFDIYLPQYKNMKLMERLEFLKEKFGIEVSYYEINDNIENMLRRFQECGYEGIVLKKKDSVYKYSEGLPTVETEWIKIK